MKETVTKSLFAVALAGLTTYFNILLIPIIMLALVMVIDYGTGVIRGWISNTLSSKIGIIGIVKKLCYLLAVIVGMVVDWVIQCALNQMGIEFMGKIFIFGFTVIIWLIINELISILENLASIGIPLPIFLVKVVGKLKNTVDNTVDNAISDNNEVKKE